MATPSDAARLASAVDLFILAGMYSNLKRHVRVLLCVRLEAFSLFVMLVGVFWARGWRSTARVLFRSNEQWR